MHEYKAFLTQQYCNDNHDREHRGQSQHQMSEQERWPASEDTSQPPQYDDLPPQDVSELAHTLQWIPSAPRAPYNISLPQPVAIPQIQPANMMTGPTPWTRAYPPILAHWDITPETFVACIDNLTIAAAPSPPVQAVQLVGTGIGFVPYHWCQLASAGIGLAAGTGSAAISITRTKLYLKEVNQRFFNPRGLKVGILSDEDLERMLAGHNQGMYANETLAPIDPHRGCVSLAERRLAALGGKVAQLDYRVPPPNMQGKNMIDKLSGKQVQMKMDRSNKKIIKKLAEQEGGKDRKGKKERKSAQDDLKKVRKLKWIVVESLAGN